MLFAMKEDLIAPCGMNCNVCASYLAGVHRVRDKGIKIPYCTGCRPRGKTCAYIKKSCRQLMENKVNFCYECSTFPCSHLSTLDKRYRTRYEMSEIDNLEHIRDHGIQSFLKSEAARWECPDCRGVVCCHNRICFDCGIDKLRARKRRYRLDDRPD